MSEFLRLQGVLIALVCVNYFARVARFIMYQCANANFLPLLGLYYYYVLSTLVHECVQDVTKGTETVSSFKKNLAFSS